MTIRFPRLTAKQIERILQEDGFVLVSQKGSHRKWRHRTKGLQVIVPEHKGKALPIGTLRSIAKNSEIEDKAWRD